MMMSSTLRLAHKIFVRNTISRVKYASTFVCRKHCRLYHADVKPDPPMWKVSQPITPQPWLYPLNLNDQPSSAFEHLIDDYDTFLFDCDGVLWGIDHFTKFSNVKKCIDGLRNLGKRVLFVTNNSMHCRDMYLKKFQEMCDLESKIDDVFSVNYAAALYLKSIAKVQGRIYAIGSKGLADELDQAGLNTFGYGTDPDPISDQRDDLLAQQLYSDVEAVLIGFDIHIGYNKIYKAASYLSDPNCIYLATNDIETRVEIGPSNVQPLTGVITEAVNSASKRRPIVIGKPHHHLMSCMLNSYPDICLDRTVMIGDSIKTDIAFASNVGVDSILVLSGSTTGSDVEKYHVSREYEMPTYIMTSIEKLSNVM